MVKKIMIVDDALLMRNIIKKCVIKLGLEIVAETGNTDNVIELYKTTAPALVFMDLILDDEEEPAGLTLIGKILDYDKNAVIIVISALKQDNITEKAIELGAKAFINKPITEFKIKELLDNIF